MYRNTLYHERSNEYRIVGHKDHWHTVKLLKKREETGCLPKIELWSRNDVVLLTECHVTASRQQQDCVHVQ